MGSNNNVISFPKKHNNPKKTEEPLNNDSVNNKEKEILSNLQSVKMIHIQETMELIMPRLFDGIDTSGFHLYDDIEENNDYHKDISIIVESIVSLLNKYYKINHPFQILAEKLFVENETGMYIINKNLNIEFPDEFLDDYNPIINEEVPENFEDEII